MAKKEEFTTKMHSELIGSEMSPNELTVCGVYGAIRRGIPKSKACKKYGITEKAYEEGCKIYLKL